MIENITVGSTKERIIDSFSIIGTIVKLLKERPEVYINKWYLQQEFNWGDREWNIAYLFLYSIKNAWVDFFENAYATLKSRTEDLKEEDLKELFKNLIEEFRNKYYGIPPVIYTGRKIVDNGRTFPASYAVLTFNEFRIRLNVLARKGLKDFDTKLSNITNLGMPVLWLDEERKLITDVTRTLTGEVVSNSSINKKHNNGINEKF